MADTYTIFSGLLSQVLNNALYLPLDRTKMILQTQVNNCLYPEMPQKIPLLLLEVCKLTVIFP